MTGRQALGCAERLRVLTAVLDHIRDGVIVRVSSAVETLFRSGSAARTARAEGRCRRVLENSGVGTAILLPSGRFDVVNQAMCDFFGYEAGELTKKTWQELTAQQHLAADSAAFADILAGRSESYRTTKRYVRADGRPIWGDLSVSCLRDAEGTVEYLVAQVVDDTAVVESRRRLAEREDQYRTLTEQMESDLELAASYVSSVLPEALPGPVQVVTRHLPSAAVGGDCYDMFWLDEDHLVVYLIDVSGHGIAPALLAMSLLNLLRSGALDGEILRSPEQVLTELNRRLPMDDHDGRYFSAWYGVYRRSTRTLRYVSAGHPPGLVVEPVRGAQLVTQLATGAPAAGLFDNTTFDAMTYAVPVGSQLLLFSDGVFDLTLADGGPWSFDQFVMLVSRLSESGELSLESLERRLKALAVNDDFNDDCSLVLVTFD